jgi:hypothetical protein
LVAELSSLNPSTDATQGLFGSDNAAAEICPLSGTWKLLYTTAYDVLSLNANPFFSLEGIFQDISPDGSSRNIIDLAPRAQILLPFVPPTTLRAVVSTAARARSQSRVGLTFTAARIGPLKLLGQDASYLPRVGGALPAFTAFGANFGASMSASETGPGFFDVEYLDESMLIIRQNEPGGIFVSTRVARGDYGINDSLN